MTGRSGLADWTRRSWWPEASVGVRAGGVLAELGPSELCGGCWALATNSAGDAHPLDAPAVPAASAMMNLRRSTTVSSPETARFQATTRSKEQRSSRPGLVGLRPCPHLLALRAQRRVTDRYARRCTRVEGPRGPHVAHTPRSGGPARREARRCHRRTGPRGPGRIP